MTAFSAFGRRWVQLPGASAARAVAGAVGLTGNETIAGVKTFSSNPILSGGGIEFPATQVPSANANTLDDYEEGTWTPTIAFGGGSTGITYGTRTATYNKIGRVVHVAFDLTLTAKGSSTGAATVSNLPFTVAVVTATASFGFYSALTGLTGAVTGIASTTSITLLQHAAASTGSVTDANFTNTSRLIGGLTYHV